MYANHCPRCGHLSLEQLSSYSHGRDVDTSR